MHPRNAAPFDRIYLYCHNGHECGSAPVNSATGRRWAAGDFTGETCGHGACGWTAE